jgi:hypothetical protein
MKEGYFGSFFIIRQSRPKHLGLEKLELFTTQFYPLIPNKGHKFRKF